VRGLEDFGGDCVMSREWAAAGLIYRGSGRELGEILNPKFGMGLAPAQAFACEGRRRRGGAPRAVPRER
jgi:hypothetical protein